VCGIAGVIGIARRDATVNPDLLEAMSHALTHRGPVGHGLWVSPEHTVGLAHRRLAIVDLSDSASQLMCDSDLTLSFNREIYNHAALFRELAQLDVGPWQTDHFDTEVILR
jgi:asparagine synthase (glutamine-hydrolysing)